MNILLKYDNRCSFPINTDILWVRLVCGGLSLIIIILILG